MLGVIKMSKKIERNNINGGNGGGSDDNEKRFFGRTSRRSINFSSFHFVSFHFLPLRTLKDARLV